MKFGVPTIVAVFVILYDYIWNFPELIKTNGKLMCVLQASLQVIPEKEAQLWWAAKELHRDKKLQDYIGKNEKTKIVVKIQKVSIDLLSA